MSEIPVGYVLIGAKLFLLEDTTMLINWCVLYILTTCNTQTLSGVFVVISCIANVWPDEMTFILDVRLEPGCK